MSSSIMEFFLIQVNYLSSKFKKLCYHGFAFLSIMKTQSHTKVCVLYNGME